MNGIYMYNNICEMSRVTKDDIKFYDDNATRIILYFL